MKNFSQNAWLVDKEVSVLGTNNSQNLGRFETKFTFKAIHENFTPQKFGAIRTMCEHIST